MEILRKIEELIICQRYKFENNMNKVISGCSQIVKTRRRRSNEIQFRMYAVWYGFKSYCLFLSNKIKKLKILLKN